MYPDIPIRDWTFENVSGGTTGEPVKFRHSGKFLKPIKEQNCCLMNGLDENR